MKVMVIGATGFIGPPLVRRLVAMGHEAVGVSRRGAFAADRNDPDTIARLAREQGVDAVVDLLAMTLETSAPLLDALAGRTGRYVLASSGDVYRQYGAIHRKEAGGSPLPVLDEDAPLRTKLHPYRSDPPRSADDPQAWMEAYDKIPIERAVAERLGPVGVVVRLPMVFGPRDRQRRFAWAIRPMREGRSRLDLDTGWAAWRTSYGFVDDVAHGLALAATHPAASGRIFNLGPPEAPDHAEWARRMAAALDWPGEIGRIGRDALAETRRRALDALDLRYPLVFDSRRIRRELGYAEIVDPADALARTIDDELSRP